MAAPTAIPHAEASAHHHEPHAAPSDLAANNTNSGLSRSPTGTSPRSMVSPIYTQAGRSAFSLPGPNSASTSPTTTTWYSAGFASGNSQRVRSPTAPFSTAGTGPVSSAVAPQRDSFPDARHPTHLRSASFGSASNASSLSSADLSNEPTTPRAEAPAASLGRTSSIQLGTSYEQIKSRRDSWSFANAPGNRWSGLASLRERTASATPFISESAPAPSSVAVVDNTSGQGPMGGLLRKFSISGSQPLKSPPMPKPNGMMRDDSMSSAGSTVGAMPTNEGLAPPSPLPPQQEDYFKTVPPTRGRQGSVGTPSTQRRRPSPMGERLLMGHFNAH